LLVSLMRVAACQPRSPANGSGNSKENRHERSPHQPCPPPSLRGEGPGGCGGGRRADRWLQEEAEEQREAGAQRQPAIPALRQSGRLIFQNLTGLGTSNNHDQEASRARYLSSFLWNKSPVSIIIGLYLILNLRHPDIGKKYRVLQRTLHTVAVRYDLGEDVHISAQKEKVFLPAIR